MDVRNDMLRRGVIVRPINDVLALRPPLVLTDDEIAGSSTPWPSRFGPSPEQPWAGASPCTATPSQ